MALSYPRKRHKFNILFKLLSDKERSEFKEFAKNSFITGGRNYSDIIEKNGTVTGSRSYWNRLSELTRIMEDYLLLKYMRDDKEERNVKLMEVFAARNINDAIESQFNRTIKLMQTQKQTINTYYNLHRLHYAFSGHEMQNDRFIGYVKHFRKHSEYVIAHFLIYIFGMQIEFNQQKLENVWHDCLANETLLNNLNADKVLSSLKDNLPELYLNVNFVFNLYKSFDRLENTEFFFEARKIFKKLAPTFSKEYLSLSYQAFINYCIDKTNAFDESFYRVLFDLYNEKLSLGFDEDIRLRNYPTNNFRDYVIVGLRLNEYNWVDKFIKKYGDLLPDEYKPDEVKITRAMLYLSRNEYSKALESLENAKRKNYLHYMDVSEMKLKIYYETADIQEAYDELTRLVRYLKTNQTIPKERRTSYEKFRRAYKLLLGLKENFTNERLSNLRNFIEKNPHFLRRPWIQEKIKGIEG